MDFRKSMVAAAALTIALAPAGVIAGNGGGVDDYEPEAAIEDNDIGNDEPGLAEEPEDGLAEDEPGFDDDPDDGLAEDEPGFDDDPDIDDGLAEDDPAFEDEPGVDDEPTVEPDADTDGVEQDELD